MKKTLVFTIIMLLLTQAVGYASPADFPGVMDEYQYREVLFITGEPVEVSGTVKVTEREGRGYTTTSSTYNLENAGLGIKLKRTISIRTELDVREDINQTVGSVSLDRFSETVTTPDARYKLEEYILNGSRITHNKPIADFFSGNWQGKKIYSIDNGDGRVTIDTVGQDIGYHHHWGSVTTSRVEGFIDCRLDLTDDEGDIVSSGWDGDFSYTTSSVTDKYMTYIRNQPTQISFHGGYMLTEEQENLIEYSYDLPEFASDRVPHRKNRERGGDSFVLKTVPKYHRLLIPELRDIGGHWAQGEIEALYSLGVFEHTSAYFGPSLPMLRSDFARAVIEAAGISPQPQQQQGRQPQQFQPQQAGLPGQQADTGNETFSDVGTNHPYYDYIMEVEKRGIIQGMSRDRFEPDGVLTRAQAVTIMIRALGFENMAPSPGFRTGFADDHEIPGWAMDSVYAAGEIGLVTGDSYGNLNPNEVLTRAEAAAILYRFIRYLQSDIRRDYRDRILY